MRRLATTGPALLAAVAFAVAGCGGGDGGGGDRMPMDPEPTPGFLSVRLTSPNAGDAGILLEVNGPGLDTLRSAQHDLFEEGTSTTRRVLLVGDIRSGTLFEFWVPDIDRSQEYTAFLRQVAEPGTFEQRSTSGYALFIDR